MICGRGRAGTPVLRGMAILGSFIGDRELYNPVTPSGLDPSRRPTLAVQWICAGHPCSCYCCVPVGTWSDTGLLIHRCADSADEGIGARARAVCAVLLFVA